MAVSSVGATGRRADLSLPKCLLALERTFGEVLCRGINPSALLNVAQQLLYLGVNRSHELSRMQVTVGAAVFHPYIQGTVFAPSTFISDLEMQYFPWKYHM